VVKQKSKFNPRKQRQFLRSIIPFAIVIVAISGLIAYLWISSEVDETLNDLEIQQTAVVELNNEISNLKDDIEYLERVDVLTARAKNELGMVFTAPETIAIYVDESTLVED
jgi:cell division protein FtsB